MTMPTPDASPCNTIEEIYHATKGFFPVIKENMLEKNINMLYKVQKTVYVTKGGVIHTPYVLFFNNNRNNDKTPEEIKFLYIVMNFTKIPYCDGCSVQMMEGDDPLIMYKIVTERFSDKLSGRIENLFRSDLTDLNQNKIEINCVIDLIILVNNLIDIFKKKNNDCIFFKLDIPT